MTNETRGGAGDDADDMLNERLTRRFESELAQAQRDYPNLSISRRTSAPAGGRALARTRWPRLASAAVAVGVLAVVGLVGVGLALRPGQIAGPQNSPVARGADGIPTEIDGQKVYRLSWQADWKNLTGSFLLGAYAVDEPIPCAPAMTIQPLSSAEADLMPECGSVELVPHATGNTDFWFSLAPRGRDRLGGWLDGPAIVMRVHTHDPEAAQCGPDVKSECQSAIVIEAVVWPEVPTQLNGERVYRAVDQASFPTSGSFLLGGRVTKPDVVPPCPMPLDKTQAEQQLIPYCYWNAIDGLQVAPIGNVDEPKNEIVVARVHINDPLGGQCPTEVSAQCRQAIVVESIVWRSDVLIKAGSTASPGPSMPGQSPVGTGQGVGPTGSQSAGPISPPSAGPSGELSTFFGPDGVPISYNGQTVYRATSLPTSTSFFFGGRLGRDAGCAPPTTLLAKPPACGYWTIDGVAVGTMVPIPESVIGSPIVVRIDRSHALGICTGGPCRTTDLLVVSEVLWYGPPAPLVPFAS